MNELLELLHRYGYQLIFANVFLEAAGLPLPAAIILLTAGAMSAVGWFKVYWVISIAIVAMMLGDVLMYFLGRWTGWTILAILCRLSLNPETCIIKSAQTFYRRGKTTLLLSKFLPGLNTVAPPLAGSLNMRLTQFLRFDSLGAALYIAFYSMIGFLFSHELERIGQGLTTAERIVTWVIAIGVVAYIAYRVRSYFKNRLYRLVPRVSVHELKEKLQHTGDQIVIYDARSHGYYEEKATRIPGSIRLEPASIAEVVDALPRDKEIYLYCT
ncbi:MAG: VTT domain-containing protein [Acidobacteria bacterium]|nr:VTT domain-containing protein [Acidobacteriota bacterium]